MQLSNSQYNEVINEPEIVGYDFTQLIGPGIDLATNIVGNWGGGSKQPPQPAPTPKWVMPLAIGGGAMMLMMIVVVATKK